MFIQENGLATDSVAAGWLDKGDPPRYKLSSVSGTVSDYTEFGSAQQTLDVPIYTILNIFFMRIILEDLLF